MEYRHDPTTISIMDVAKPSMEVTLIKLPAIIITKVIATFKGQPEVA